ncbi:MAG: SMI1/KNR4 family protein [Cryobacterium sp.]|nr:SMI1/KNR4 family protein [Cryobacterium sp.]
MQVISTFNRLLSLLEPYQRGTGLPPPAKEVDLSRLQASLGRQLPPDLVAAYRICDGGPNVPGNPLDESLFYSYRFLSVGQMLSLNSGLENTRRSEGPPFPREPLPSFPPGAVQDLLTSSDWVAFADDRAGGYLAIDYLPGPSGTVGQVINFGRDDAAHFQLGTSFENFLERALYDYEEKRFHYFFGETMMFVDRLLEQTRQRK